MNDSREAGLRYIGASPDAIPSIDGVTSAARSENMAGHRIITFLPRYCIHAQTREKQVLSVPRR